MAKIDKFVFKDTGVVVGIRHVSPLLLIKLRERYPAPKPPMQEVVYGDEKVMEPNSAHPDFITAQTEYDQAMERRSRELLISRGVVIEWTDEKNTELEELKGWWAETYQEPFVPTNQTFDYVSYIAIGSDSDLEDLVNALIRRSQPTEEAVKDAQARFPSEVSR